MIAFIKQCYNGNFVFMISLVIVWYIIDKNLIYSHAWMYMLKSIFTQSYESFICFLLWKLHQYLMKETWVNVHWQVAMYNPDSITIKWGRGWRRGSNVMSPCSSCRGHGLSSQHPHHSSLLPMTPVLGDLM